jgi:hypothetical protein
MKTKLVALSAVLFSLVAVPAQATVDAIIQYNIPYRSIQTDDICFMRLPLYTSIGIPAAVLTEASLTPTQILKDFPRRQYVNLNLAAPARAMVHTYVSDSVTPAGVWEYTMKLDVTALSTYNGTSLTGRTNTYRSAKLALLAIARNLDDVSNGSYRLKVTFVGLPSATSVPGTKLNATTAYPYTSASPLLIAYERELIDVEGSCPEL